MRAAQAGVLVEMGVLRPHEVTGPSAGTGVFGGYLYMSASAMRLFGVRMLGMSASDADEQVMGAVEDVPPYRRAKGDRNLIASVLVTRTALRLLRRPDLSPLEDARRDAVAWLGTMPDLATASTAELISWVRTYPPRLAASMQRLLRFSMMAGAPRGILDRILLRPGVPVGLGNRIVSGTGDVDSAQLALRLWQLGRMVAANTRLTAEFDAGLDDIAIRIAGTPLEPAVADFLQDHGHRGNDEYELASSAWVMDTMPVYATIDRLRRAPVERDPAAAGARLHADAEAALTEALQATPRPARGMVRRAAEVARLGSIARERAKDILVLENLGARRVLHELAAPCF